MAEKSIGIVLGVSGDKQAAAAIEQVGQRGATAMERLQTAVTRAGNASDFAEGKIKKLNRGINDAAGSVQLISPLVGGLGGNFGALAGTIGNVADVFGTLSSLLLRNPIGLAAIAITGAVTAFAAFSQTVDGANKTLGASSVVAGDTKIQFDKLIDPLKAIAGLYDEVIAKQVQALGGSKAVAGASLESTRQQLAAARAALSAAQAPLGNDARGREVDDRPSQVRAAEDIARQQRRAAAESAAKVEIKKRADEVARLTTELQRLETQEQRLREIEDGKIGAETGSTGEGFRDIVSGIRAEEEAARERGRAAAEALRSRYEALSSSLDPVIAAQRELAAATSTLEEAQRAGIISTEDLARMKDLLAQKAYAASEAGRAEAAAIADGVAAAERAITPLERYEQQLDNIQRALNANKISEEQAERARGKVKDELDKASGDTTAAAKNARELGLAFSSAFEDAIVGGKTFRDVVKGLGQDLLRVFIRRQLTEPLLEFFNVASKGGSGGGSSGGGGIFGSLGNLFGGSSGGSGGGLFDGIGSIFGSIGSFFGFANGGLMTPSGPLPLQRYAGGGVANRPQLAMFGEGSRPEAYVPLPDGRTIPVTMRGAGGVSVHNVWNIDARGADADVDRRIRLALAEAQPGIVENSVRQVEYLANRGGAFSKTVGRRRGR